MGNKKNRKTQQISRHVYVRKKVTKASHHISSTRSQPSSPLMINNGIASGYRIVNIDQLHEYTNRLTVHAAKCSGSVILSGEKKCGLASIFGYRCDKCHIKITFVTSKKVKSPKYRRFECNIAAVWGEMATGGGHSHLQSTMATLGVSAMDKNSFITTERMIGEWWRDSLQETILEAGVEEKRLAEERGDYHQDVPYITVIVDGGWSKRSHKHSYNAKSGVAIIIGSVTKKLLYIGVRNKYCSACAQGIPVDNHSCYKNWTASSSEMETDIILEGFKKAEQTHGIRYLKFIGDGDSSVFPTLMQNVPVWGRYIKKLECANHVCKCYRSSLEKLIEQNPQYKGKGGLTKK